MAWKPKPDVLQALADWKAGKPVRVIELGHAHRMHTHPDRSHVIDDSKIIHRDQDRAYAFLFRIMEACTTNEAPPPNGENHAAYLELCALLRTNHDGLTEEEAQGAEGLAWKALCVGWRKALDGFQDSDFIELAKPAEEKSLVSVNGAALR